MVLSALSSALVAPIARSSVSLMPPMCESTESQALPPDVDEGVKQILCSPESAAVNVNWPSEDAF